MANLDSRFCRRMKERSPIAASSGMQMRMGRPPDRSGASRPRLGRGEPAQPCSDELPVVDALPPRPAQISLPSSTGATLVGRREDLIPPLREAPEQDDYDADDSATQIQPLPVLPIGSARHDPEAHRITARVPAIAAIPPVSASSLSIEIDLDLEDDEDEDAMDREVTVPRHRHDPLPSPAALDGALDDLLVLLDQPR